MSHDPATEELHKETLAFIRWMIYDHAFSTEFLVTAIQEYYLRNSVDERARGEKGPK